MATAMMRPQSSCAGNGAATDTGREQDDDYEDLKSALLNLEGRGFPSFSRILLVELAEKAESGGLRQSCLI